MFWNNSNYYFRVVSHDAELIIIVWENNTGILYMKDHVWSR